MMTGGLPPLSMYPLLLFFPLEKHVPQLIKKKEKKKGTLTYSAVGNIIVFLKKNIFYLEMYQNNIFYFLKIIFDISISKISKNIKKKLI
jgi:hypothetical protein